MVDFSSPEQALQFVQELDYPYFPGAIYPSELAFFVYECERARVDYVIESGRENGYSTAVIAAYGEAKGMRVVSIDPEANRLIAQQTRNRLQRFANLRLVIGDSFECLPYYLRDAAKCRVALLIDGPKMHDAIALSAAAVAIGPVVMVAHHNTGPETEWYSHFAFRFSSPRRLEDSDLVTAPNFAFFREWEEGVTSVDQRGLRSISHTSLVCSVLPEQTDRRRYLCGPSFRRTLNAKVWYWWWKSGQIGGRPMLAWLQRI